MFLPFLMSKEVISDTEISAARPGKAESVKVVSLTLTKTCAFNIHYKHSFNNAEEKCKLQSSSFGVLCFITLKWIVHNRLRKDFKDNAANELH